MSTRQSLALSFLDRYAGLAISVVSSMVLARLLAPADVGVFLVVMVLLALAAALQDFGAGKHLVKEHELSHEWIRAGRVVQQRSQTHHSYNPPSLDDPGRADLYAGVEVTRNRDDRLWYPGPCPRQHPTSKPTLGALFDVPRTTQRPWCTGAVARSHHALMDPSTLTGAPADCGPAALPLRSLIAESQHPVRGTVQ